MVEHTPGPWRVWSGFPDCRVTVAIGSGPAPYIAKVNAGRDEYRANARLIAAAPDLLAALERSYVEMCADGAKNMAVCEAARAAIAKARNTAGG